MSFEVFLELTPVEFYDALWEKEKHEEHIVLAQIRTICETIRLQTYHLMNAQLPRGHRIRDLKRLGVFTWEKQTDKPAQTKEEMKATMKAIAKAFTKKKKDGKRRRNVSR